LRRPGGIGDKIPQTIKAIRNDYYKGAAGAACHWQHWLAAGAFLRFYNLKSVFLTNIYYLSIVLKAFSRVI
jgi:hypothetical protein